MPLLRKKKFYVVTDGPRTHTESNSSESDSVLRHAVTCTSVRSSYASNRMIIERKVSMASTNNNRRLHLKMQARGVKHDRTLCVLRQQRKGKGVTMVSTNNNKKSFWKQVRRSDQLRYPIHNRSFVAHGRLWMPCAPAAKTCFEHLHASVKSYVFSNVAILNLYVLLNIACWLWVLETDIDTHTPPTVGAL